MAADCILVIMATQPRLAPLRGGASAIRSAIADYWALSKPEINLLIAIATSTGFYLAVPGPLREFPWLRLVRTLLGTLLVASGTGTLNQYVEGRFDAQTRRTVRRPLAAGRLNAAAVLWFGIALSAIGCIYLATAINVLASLLALLALLSYLFLYTPLKRKTPMCVLVGALPGGVPPLIGWAAASGKLSCEAWALYAMLFVWQFPHFMAIAWMYREDYDRAAYRVLPPAHTRVSVVTLQTILPLLALFPISLFAVSGGQPSILSGIGALLLSVGFLYHGAQFVRCRSSSAARWLLLASIIYLPSLSVLAVFLRVWRVL